MSGRGRAQGKPGPSPKWGQAAAPWREQAAEREPPPKRPRRAPAAPTAAPRAAGEESWSVRLEHVPSEYSHETLVELHEAMGLDSSVLLSTEFSQAFGSLQEQSVTLRYPSEEDAAAAAELLDGQPVATGSGEALCLSATAVSEAAPPAPRSPSQPPRKQLQPPPMQSFRGPSAAPSSCPSSAPSRVPPRARPGALARTQEAPPRTPATPSGSPRGSLLGAGSVAVSVQTSKAPPAAPRRPPAAQVQGRQAPADAAGEGGSVWDDSVEGGGIDAMDSIYPSVRLSEVPVEYTEEVIVELHEASGLTADILTEIVLLEPADASSATRCVVLKYADQASAETAVQVLQGRAVRPRSGRPKVLQAELVHAGGDASGEFEVPAEGEPEAQAECCSEGARCMGKAGELIYEDAWTGDAICEACWAVYYPHARGGA